ncbi:MAG: pilus assembly protein [Alphaproteobacteria bacterium]|nr:pilus assembly protein [Alphaproteobacteria bacterium]
MKTCRMLAATTRLVGDRAGIAAVEFALLLPVLFTLFIGSYETSYLLLTYLKLEAAAEAAADLVAQTNVSTVLAAADFTYISAAVDLVMTPLSTSGLKIAYASVTYNTGSAKIDWHYEVNSATPLTIATLPNGVNAASLGNATAGSSDSVIVVQLTYPYTSPISNYLSQSFTLYESAFNRPRYVTCVPTTMNTNSVCP